MKPLHAPTTEEFQQSRKRAGLSQSSLADLLGVHPNTIKNIEAGRTKCSPQLWYFTQARLAERNQQILDWIVEHGRRWNSQMYRNEWLRKAREKYGD